MLRPSFNNQMINHRLILAYEGAGRVLTKSCIGCLPVLFRDTVMNSCDGFYVTSEEGRILMQGGVGLGSVGAT